MTFSQVLTPACPVRQEVVSAAYSLNGVLIHPCSKVYRDSGKDRVNGWGVLR